MICCFWAVLKVRGRSCTTSPAAAASRPTSDSDRTASRRPLRRGRGGVRRAGGCPPVPVTGDGGPGGRRGTGTGPGSTGRSASGPGPLPPGGSGRNPTPACYGLNRTGAVGCDRLRDQPIPSAGVLVGRKRGIHLVDPGQHAAADMDRIRKSSVLNHGQDFGAALTALAVQHYPPVLRHPLEGGAREEFPLGDQRGAGDGDDLVFVRLPYVDEEDVLVPVEHLL